MKNTRTILIYAENERGVLERILMIARQKRYNLEQITASDTERKNIKQIIITYSDIDKKFNQMMKQMNKIIEVIDVKEVNQENSIQKEVAFIKIEIPKKMNLFNKIISENGVEMVYSSDKEIILRIVGDTDFIQEIREKVRKDFKIKEFSASGTVAMLK